jgi:hypothetical protein
MSRRTEAFWERGALTSVKYRADGSDFKSLRVTLKDNGVQGGVDDFSAL